MMQWISEISTAVNNAVWGPWMLTFMIGVGVFLTLRSGFLQFRMFRTMVRETIGSLFSKKEKKKDAAGVSPFQAVATALAATIGTGSITGLAAALSVGGPGAIFWMWVSAALGMVTKYFEIVLSLYFREKNEKGQWVGGPMYYIKNGLRAPHLAVAFAIFAIFACFGIGNAAQANAISTALESEIHLDPIVTGVILMIFAGSVILGGIKRIASVNEKLVPIMAVFYILACILAVVSNIEKLPRAIDLIFEEAFSVRAVVGGSSGFGIALAMRSGFAKGIFSNEAGLGSAPIAHAASNTDIPEKQGLWGMFEVFFTTIVICTLSALVLLTSDLWHLSEYQGAALSIAAFEKALPGFGGICVTLATILFSLSTILGWAYYGEVCIGFLVKKSSLYILIFRFVYVIIVFLGAVGSLDLIWGISETMNGLMAIPNLIGLLGLSGFAVSKTNTYFKNRKGS